MVSPVYRTTCCQKKETWAAGYNRMDGMNGFQNNKYNKSDDHTKKYRKKKRLSCNQDTPAKSV